MNIAVNTRLLLKDKLEGIGWFTYESLKRITVQHPEHTFYFLFDRPFDEQFIFSDNVKPIIIPPQARHPFLYFAWFEFSVPLILNKIKADIFLSPDGFLSLNTTVKSVPVIHDLNFEHRPQDIPWLTRNYYQYYFPRFARKAARIATVSEYSKSDLVKAYTIDPAKIDVVYNGASEGFKPLKEIEKAEIKRLYSKGCDYFLYVGALHPRKNLVNLLKAFDAFKESTGFPTKLVIVGKKMWQNQDMRSCYEQMRFKEEVIFTGRVSSDNLYKITAAALALTYVSVFEGFGIPILEAFYCNTPVITSNTTSMPEVGGNAALYVDPFSVESITNGMIKVSKDEKLRMSLIFNSEERRKLFTWQKTADNLWLCIEKAME